MNCDNRWPALTGTSAGRRYVRYPVRMAIGIMSLYLMMATGCGKPSTLNTTYGRSRGDGTSSVNGLSVLAEMYSRAGYDVSAWSRLSPKLESEQVIIWAPDRFSVPTPDEIEYLEKWLGAASGRTLIYIGRDYDASLDYWSRLMEEQPSQRLSFRREVARARMEHHKRRQQTELEDDCAWFSLDTKVPSRVHQKATGPWPEAVPNRSFRIRSETELVFPKPTENNDEPGWHNELQFEPLIEADDQMLAARAYRASWQGSQLILINNGSWLLNLPLTQESHRMLAGQLIASCGPPGSVCFLEAGESEMVITDRDTSLPLVLQAFTVWPFNLLALHLLMLGIVFCFSIFPIMGMPRPFAEDHVSDFGKHVHALGELMERERNVDYAQAQIRMFREVVGVPKLGESGEPRRGRVL